MRIAILSDIHANLPALRAVLDDVGAPDAIWHLGDVVGYGPHPDEVIDVLRERAAVGVRGNHDAAAIGALDTIAFNSDARRAMAWTIERLAPDSRAWLGDLPERLVPENAKPELTLVHGSPRDPIWEYVVSAPLAQAGLAACETSWCMVGHTHVPLVFREDDGHLETMAPGNGSRIAVDGRRVLANPGSVGQPRDGDPRASYAVLDMDLGTLTWRRVAYPVEETQRAMAGHGLPTWLIQRLAIGH